MRRSPCSKRPSNSIPGSPARITSPGLRFKADGNYPAALDEFSKASALYPRDRVVRNQMGRMLFLQRKYKDAVAEFDKTLAVDPEDLEAHYDLMLCYRGLRDDAQAAREEKLYLRFKADESSRAITGPFKLTHPEDNNEAQPIHEHVSVALGPARAEGSRQKAEGRRKQPECRKQKSESRKKNQGEILASLRNDSEWARNDTPLEGRPSVPSDGSPRPLGERVDRSRRFHQPGRAG